MKNKLFRFLPLVFCVCFTFVVLCTPVSAATFGNHVVDLMTGSEIVFGTERDNYPYIYSGYNTYYGTDIYYFWEIPNRPVKVQYIYVTIYSSVSPRTPTLRYSSSSVAYSGALIGSYNGYYQYKFNCGVYIDNITLHMIYGGGSRDFSIVSVEGYTNISEPVSGATCYLYKEWISSAGQQVDPVLSSQSITFPYSDLRGQTSDFTYHYYYLDIKEYAFNTYDSITFVFDSIAAQTLVSASLYAAGTSNPVYAFDRSDIEHDSFAFGPTTIPPNTEHIPITHYVTIDLTDIDLEYYTLDIVIAVAPVHSVINNTYDTYINVRNVFFTPEVQELKWYEEFFLWFKQLFDDPTGGKVEDQTSGMQQEATDFNDISEGIKDIPDPTIDVDLTFEPITIHDSNAFGILTTLSSIPKVEFVLQATFILGFAGFILYGLKF